MMRRLLTAGALLAALVLGGVAVAGATSPANKSPRAEPAATTAPTTTASTTASTPDADARRMGRELDDLASAWAAAGGTYGYPFWAKAQERWRMGEISASLFREYVSGYRDRMHLGCQLVDDVSTSDGVADDTHRLVSDACAQRVKGLAAQQRWLDDLIAGPVAADPAASTADRDAATAARDTELAAREAEAQEALQRSFRDTRQALDLAQAELDANGLERLHEDAFM